MLTSRPIGLLSSCCEPDEKTVASPTRGTQRVRRLRTRSESLSPRRLGVFSYVGPHSKCLYISKLSHSDEVMGGGGSLTYLPSRFAPPCHTEKGLWTSTFGSLASSPRKSAVNRHKRPEIWVSCNHNQEWDVDLRGLISHLLSHTGLHEDQGARCPGELSGRESWQSYLSPY